MMAVKRFPVLHCSVVCSLLFYILVVYDHFAYSWILKKNIQMPLIRCYWAKLASLAQKTWHFSCFSFVKKGRGSWLLFFGERTPFWSFFKKRELLVVHFYLWLVHYLRCLLLVCFFLFVCFLLLFFVCLFFVFVFFLFICCFSCLYFLVCFLFDLFVCLFFCLFFVLLLFLFYLLVSLVGHYLWLWLFLDIFYTTSCECALKVHAI